jgi:hypothetical protein
MPISANPTRILKELGDADHLMSVPLVAPSKGYIRHPAEAGFCAGRGSTPKTVTLAAQSLCNGFAILSSMTSNAPVTAAEIFHLMKTKPKSGAPYCWLNFDLSKPEDFEASMEKHYHDKTMRGVATKRETVFVLRGPNKGTSRAVVAKAAGKKSSDTKNTAMTVYDSEEMSVAAAALKKMNDTKRETVFVLRGPNKGTSRAVIAKAAGKKRSDTMTEYNGEKMSVAAAAGKRMSDTKNTTMTVLRGPNKGTSRAVVAKAAGKKSSDTMTEYNGEKMSVAAAAGKKRSEPARHKYEARAALADAAIAVAAATAPFQVGQAVRKINTKKNSKAGKTRIVRKIFQNGFFTFVDTGNLQTMAKFMPDE